MRGGMLQRVSDRRAETALRFHPEDRVRAEQLGQRRPATVTAPGIHPDGAMHRMGLLAHRLDEARQQPGTVVGYHHGGDDVTETRNVL